MEKYYSEKTQITEEKIEQQILSDKKKKDSNF